MFDFLKKLLYNEPGQRPRVYNFPLPYKMEASSVFLGVGILQREGIFKKLPEDMQEKMIKCKEKWYPLKITKSDLDRIDDKTWTYIATKLNLKWKYEDII